MAKNQIRITNNDRIFTAGKTGSGKTTVALSLLLNAPRLLIVDSKDGIDNDDFELKDIRDIKDIKGENKFRFRVVDDAQALLAVEKCYSVGNCMVYIDEVTAFIRPKQVTPQAILNVWQRGRSRGVGGWATTQAPVSIPLEFIREANIFFCFQLNLEDDRKRMSQVMGKQVLAKPIDKHGFYYYDANTSEKVIYYRGLGGGYIKGK